MPQVKFEPSKAVEDIGKAAAAIGAPFSESVTRKVIETFPEQFADGGVILRTSNKPTAGLDYRFFMNKKTDCMSLAVGAGFITKDDPMSQLIYDWSKLYDGAPEASCDFEASKGLAKVWLFFGAIRPISEILAAPGVPKGISSHLPTFQSLGLEEVQHVAVDYQKRSINIYFSFYGETTRERAAALAKLAGSGPPDDTWFNQMTEYLPLDGYPFSVTMKLDGTISRVCFYALRGLPNDSAAKVDGAISRFWETAPCYSPDDFKSLGWSFGGEPYLKSERGYTGDISSFGEYWSVFPSTVEAAA